MSYSRNALPLHSLPRMTNAGLDDLLLVETTSASQAISFGDLLQNATTVFYGFYIDSNGHLQVDIISDQNNYYASKYKEWYVGGAGTTFTLTVSSLVIDI